MRYSYEYKEKEGIKVCGDNLEQVQTIDNGYVKLIGSDINGIPYYWYIVLDMSLIEYLIIRPMEEEK